jgi:hypothetical protein
LGPRGALLLLTALEQNAARLRDELSGYHPNELIDAYLADAEPRRT